MYEALFARFLIIGQQPNIQLLSVFQYKLSPVPHSLVDELGYLLKGDKSVLMKRLGSDSENFPKPNVLLVDHIVWRTSGTNYSGWHCGELQGLPHKWWKVTRCNYLYHLCSIGLRRIKCQRSLASEKSWWGCCNISTDVLLLDFHLAMPSNAANKCQLNQLLCSFSHGHNINMVRRENSLVHRNEAGITL